MQEYGNGRLRLVNMATGAAGAGGGGGTQNNLLTGECQTPTRASQQNTRCQRCSIMPFQGIERNFNPFSSLRSDKCRPKYVNLFKSW